MNTRHRASIVCVHQGKLLTVLLTDPMTQITRHFLPGGQIEQDETPSEAAQRETYEETGYQVRIHQESEVVAEYQFFWNGHNIPCKTHFFTGELQNDQRNEDLKDADYNKGIEWVKLQEIKHKLGFHEEIYHSIIETLKHGSSN